VIVSERNFRRLVELLRAEPGFERAEPAGAPQPLTGGFWASISLVHLANVEPPADTLVLRVMPDPALAAKETVIQREITRQGFPAPAVRLCGGAGAGVGGAFMLMDRAPGVPALAGLDGIAALRRLPALARRLPAILGLVSAALHALDPDPLRIALADTGVTAPSDAPAFLAALTEAADRIGRADLRAAALWLAGHPPPSSRHVIAHGDLHPFNIVIDGDDWRHHPGPAVHGLVREPARAAHSHRVRQLATGVGAARPLVAPVVIRQPGSRRRPPPHHGRQCHPARHDAALTCQPMPPGLFPRPGKFPGSAQRARTMASHHPARSATPEPSA